LTTRLRAAETGCTVSAKESVVSSGVACATAGVAAADDAPRLQRSDVAAVLVFAILLCPIAARVAVAVHGFGEVAILLLALPLGLLAADLTSGLLHWTCDTFFDRDTPVIGRSVIEPFRDHHRDPLAITRKSTLRVCRANLYTMSVGLTVGWCWEHGAPADCHSLLAHAAWFWYACALAATNQFHRWAHAGRVPRPVRWLQAGGMVLSPAHHARHHAPPFRRAYCITTGWSDVALDALRVFDGLERAVRGLHPPRAR
jgi:ubiquitin-conjugating enzyme E2 variant